MTMDMRFCQFMDGGFGRSFVGKEASPRAECVFPSGNISI